MAYQDIGIRVLILGVGEARRSIGSVQGDIKSLENTISGLSGTSASLGRAISSVGSMLTSFGRTLTLTVTTPLLALDAALITSGINFEDAFTGVTKTIDGVALGFDEILAKQLSLDNAFKQKLGEDFGIELLGNLDAIKAGMTDAEKAAVFADPAFGSLTEKGIDLRNAFRELALELPVSAVELAKIAQLGGQFKVPADQIVEFTKVMAELGMATNLSGEEAATAIAKFANIFGIESENLTEYAQSFGAALVALGNTTATTEADIMSMATRIAITGRITGLTEAEILGLSAALSSMGPQAEMGGSALSRIFQELYMAVAQGGDSLAQFTAITGQSAEEFQKAFGEDPIAQMLLFTKSLSEMQEAGQVSKETLTALGMSGIRVSQVWMSLAENQDLVRDSIETATVAWEEQIALQEEAQKRMFTVKGQIQLLKNAFVDLGITLFDLYRQDIVNIITGFRDLLKQIKKLDPRVQKTIFNFSLLAAAAGPVMIVLGTLIQNVGVVVTAFQALPGVILKVISVFGSMTLALAPVIAAAGLVYLAYKKNFLGLKDLVDSTFGSIVKTFKEFKVGDILKDTLGDALKGDFGGITDNLKSLLDITLGWFSNTFKPNLERWFNENGVFQSFSNSLKKNATVSGIEEVFGDFFNSIKKVLANRVGELKDSFKVFGEGIFGFFENLKGIRVEGFVRVIGMLSVALLDLGMAVTSKGLSLVGSILPPIGAAIKDFVSALSDLLMGDYSRAFSTLIEGFMHLGEVGTILKDKLGLQPALDRIVGFVDQVKQAFEKFKSSEIGQLLQKYIVKPFLEIKDVFKPLVAGFKSFWTIVKSADWSFLSVLWEWIKKIGKVVLEVFGGVAILAINAFIELFKMSMNLLANILPTVGNIIKSFANFFSSIFKGDLEGVLESFIGVFRNIFAFIVQILAGINAFLTTVSQNIISFIKDATGINEWLAKAGQDIAEWVTTAITDMVKFAADAWTALSSFGTVINDTILVPLGDAAKAIWNFFFSPDDSVKTTISDFVASVGEWFSALDLKTTFQNTFQDAATFVKNLFSWGTLGSISNAIFSFVNSIPLFFNDLPTMLTTAFTEVINLAVTGVKNLFSWGTEGSLVTSLIGFVNTLPLMFAGLLDTLNTELWQPFKDSVDKIIDGIFGDGEGSLKSKLSGLGTAVRGWLEDFVTAAGEMAGGFIEAFGDAFKGLKTTVIQALNDAIPDNIHIEFTIPVINQKVDADIDITPNPIPMDSGGFGLPGHPYVINPKAGPEMFIPGSKGNFYPNFDKMLMSTLLDSLSQLISPMATDNRQYSPVYSPNFNTTPNQELLDANGSMYDQWVTSQQGVMR